jgi:hypothetical protein
VAGFVYHKVLPKKITLWQMRLAVGVPIFTVIAAGLADSSSGDLIQLMSLPFGFVAITAAITLIKIMQD